MPPKRSLDLTSDLQSSPQKRRHIFSCASSPGPSGSTSTSNRSQATPFSTPYTTPRTTPYPIPSDSPTNPFGRKRVLHLALPRVTSFSKHLPLRFQLVQTGAKSVRRDREGVYRIVQVPLNYTFRHLRKLILFLFGGIPVEILEDEDEDVGGRSTRKKGKGRRRSQGSDEQEDADDPGHLFEVKKDAMMYSASYKPGQIRSGETWAKVSSVRDPYRYRDEDEDSVTDEDPTGEDDRDGESGTECNGKEWTWEGEEDFTLAHTWPVGGDLERAIIYHHTPTTQIHITLNTVTIPRRKGISNRPFVFRARGLIRLPGIPPPPRVIEGDNEGWILGSGARDTDAEGDPDPEYLPPPAEDDDEFEENPTANISTAAFNAPDVFSNFLSRSSGLSFPGYGSSPILYRQRDLETPLSSSPTSISSISSISCESLSTFSTISTASTSSLQTTTMPSSPSSLLTIPTPFPAKKHTRKRVEHAHRRMVRLAKKIGALLRKRGEDEDEEDGDSGEAGEGGEEVDELAEDDGDREEGEKEKGGKTKSKAGYKVKTESDTEPELDWDPFGDEAEL